jgi:hypothetical protein
MYLFGAVFFLVAGAYITPIINAISLRICGLPLYPLPFTQLEGAFWRVLSVSMMAMLAWICGTAYRNPRANYNLIPVLLISKFCSTASYFVLFLLKGYLAFIIGSLTDGPIFIFTAVVWFLALPGKELLTRKEEDILFSFGKTILPRGGAFELGFEDLRESTLADIRKMISAFDGITLAGMRFGLHLINFLPILVVRRAKTMLNLSLLERETFLRRAESHRWSLIRTLVMLMKINTVVPFFNQTEAAQTVGYFPEKPSQS